MGREIRRVTPDWKHPMQECSFARKHNGQCYKPLFDRSFEESARIWLDEAIAWDKGTHPSQEKFPNSAKNCPYFWQYNGNPPNPEHYRPNWREEDRTAFQMYETVSEGTPKSPVFLTIDELRYWLINTDGWSEEGASSFCGSGWMPTEVIKL